MSAFLVKPSIEMFHVGGFSCLSLARYFSYVSGQVAPSSMVYDATPLTITVLFCLGHTTGQVGKLFVGIPGAEGGWRWGVVDRRFSQHICRPPARSVWCVCVLM